MMVRKEWEDRLPEFDYMRSKPFEDKIIDSFNIIKKAVKLYPSNLAIACSFGKDSTVVLHMVSRIKPKIPVVFNNTGVEYKETIEYKNKLVEDWNLNFIETHPIRSFWNVVKEFGHPSVRQSKPNILIQCELCGKKLDVINHDYNNGKRIDKGYCEVCSWFTEKMSDNKKKAYVTGAPRCCYYLKDKPMAEIIKEKNYLGIITGLMASESFTRKWTIVKRGTDYKMKKGMPHEVHRFLPIAYWTNDDIWKYYHEFNLPINEAYEKFNVERTGCLPCSGHIGWEDKLLSVNPKLYVKIQADRKNFVEIYKYYLLYSSNLDKRIKSARELVKFENIEAVEALLKGLNDPNRDVANEAMCSLIEIGKSHLDYLCNRLKNETDINNQFNLIEVLGNIQSDQIRDLFIEIYNENNKHLKLSVIRNLTKFPPEPKIISCFNDAINENDELIVHWANIGLKGYQ